MCFGGRGSQTLRTCSRLASVYRWSPSLPIYTCGHAGKYLRPSQTGSDRRVTPVEFWSSSHDQSFSPVSNRAPPDDLWFRCHRPSVLPTTSNKTRPNHRLKRVKKFQELAFALTRLFSSRATAALALALALLLLLLLLLHWRCCRVPLHCSPCGRFYLDWSR